jgi:ferredoxin
VSERRAGRFLVSVDPERCELHGECVAAAPEIFEIEDGAEHVTVRLRDIGPEHEAAAMDAFFDCPVQAIAVSPAQA